MTGPRRKLIEVALPLDPDWDPATDGRFTVWEVAHHLIGRIHEEGEEAAAALLGAVAGWGAA